MNQKDILEYWWSSRGH